MQVNEFAEEQTYAIKHKREGIRSYDKNIALVFLFKLVFMADLNSIKVNIILRILILNLRDNTTDIYLTNFNEIGIFIVRTV